MPHLIGLKKIVKPYIKRCDPQEMIVGSWLGVSRQWDQFVQASSSLTTKPLNYTNWHKSPKPAHTCGIFFENGFWDSQDGNLCPRIQACPVCRFSFIPTLTLAGTCEESIVDYYWYVTATDHEGLFYDGYKGDRLYPMDNYKTWYWVTPVNTSITYRISLTSGWSVPIGNKFWTAEDAFCNFEAKDQIELSFSTCVLGSDFTCNNGECISKYKRCDNILDCGDHSDEDNCQAILIDPIYDRSR